MFWNRSTAPPSQQVRSVPPSPEEHRSAAETLSELLIAYGTRAFDTEFLSAREAQRRCTDWAAQSLRTAPARRAKLHSGAPEPRTNWSGLLQFFTEHRMAESTSVKSAHIDLADSIRGFARMFQEYLLADRSADKETVKVLLRISNGLGAEDDAQVLSAAEELVTLVQGRSADRAQLSGRRLGTLRAHVAKLERQVAGNRNPLMLDAATRLHNAQALTEHVEFISCVGNLFQSPPHLSLFQLNTATLPEGCDLDSGAERAADGLVRILFSSEHYVARAEPALFAAVLSGVSVDEALKLSEEARRSALAELPNAELGAVTCSLVPGESAAAWEGRARAHLEEASARGPCELSAVPGAFVEQIP